MALPIALIAAVGLKAGGDIWGGVNTRNALRHQATTLNSQARLEEEAAAFNASQTARKFDELLGEQHLSTAVSGVEEEGSVLDIFKKTIQDKQISVEHIIADGRNRANALRNQARQAKKAGRNALISGFLSAGGSAASAFTPRPNAPTTTT